MKRRVVLELEGRRDEVDRALGAFFKEMQRMDFEAVMNEPIWSGFPGAIDRLHHAHRCSLKGTLTIREDIG